MLQRRDLYAGGVCVLAGLATVAEAQRYPLGTLREIGPGFQPLALGVLLALVGLLIAANAFSGPAEAEVAAEPPEWRGWICIVAGVGLFIALVRPAGLALAGFASTLVWALGDRQTTLRGALVLAACVAAFGTILFGTFLGIDLPLWPTVFAS
jgi:hypothetical protein